MSLFSTNGVTRSRGKGTGRIAVARARSLQPVRFDCRFYSGHTLKRTRSSLYDFGIDLLQSLLYF